MDFKNKIAIVTGASRGMGKAIALNLAQKGTHLALVARNENDLREVAQACEKHQVRAKIFPFDLTEIHKIPELIKSIHQEFKEVHMLVNDAGKYTAGDPFESDLKEWDMTLDLNFRSVYHLTNQVLPWLSQNQEGSIVNICSIASLMTSKGGEIYSASKHALKGYAGSLFESIREKGVKVINIYPGFVNTSMVDGDKLDRKKMIQPEDVASAVIWAIGVPGTTCATDITLRPQKSPYMKTE
jgi:short-subunit dehydrogenase